MFLRRSANTTHLEDHELIGRFRDRHDLEILGTLYERHMHLVYGVCLKYLKNRDDSQDAVMQIFEKLIRELEKHEVGNFRSWLYVLAKNHCLMELRKRKSAGSDLSVEINPDTDMEIAHFTHPLVEDPMESDMNGMRDCMEKLPDEQKKCITMFYLEQRSYKEVAGLTGFELNKVKSYIQNGKRNLKQCMENNREGN